MKRTNYHHRVLLVLALFTCGGCGGTSAGPVDASAARRALESALTAWQQGESPGSLKQSDPPITVQDLDWKNGVKLVEYEILPDAQLDRLNLHAHVKLTLEDASGNQTQKTVQYVVATDPVTTVFREFSM